MPLYEVQQYESHIAFYNVEADSPAEAVRKVLDGEAEDDLVDGSPEYVEVDETRGIKLAEQLVLARELDRLGVTNQFRDQIVPSIRTVRLLPDSKADGS